MTDAVPILSESELKIYRMKKKKPDLTITEIAKDLELTVEEVKLSLTSINEKTNVLWRDYRVYSLSSTYSRIFDIARAYSYEEKANINHVFNIDFSDIYLYLYPHNARPRDQEMLGFVFYMFNSKTTEDKYCMLPSATWELLDYIVRVGKKAKSASKYEGILIDKSMNNFFELLKSPPRNLNVFERQIKNYYFRMGGWTNILALGDLEKLDNKLKNNLRILKRMTDDKILLPIEDVAEENKWKKNDAVYREALVFLNDLRPGSDINNQVDALNIATTYGLTEEHHDKVFFRMVSHSRLPSEVFRRIKFNDIAISCCPQFMTSLFLLKRDLAKAIGVENIESRLAFLEKSIPVLDYIKSNSCNLQYPQIYVSPNPELLDDQELMAKAFDPVYRLLSNYQTYQEEIYDPFIKKSLEVNAGTPKYHSAETVEDLKTIFKDARTYLKNMDDASEAIMTHLKETYGVLYRFLNEKHMNLLTRDMVKLFASIEKS